MPNFSLDELLGSRYFNQAIGFDPFFKTIDSVLLNSTTPSYPPHVHNETSDDDDELQYNHRGIAKRNFKKVFALGRHIEVENVIFKNGLLTVHLKESVPESEKLRSLSIMSD